MLLMPALCIAQTVKVSQYDNFIKKYRIEIEPVVVQSSPGAKVSLSLSAAGTGLFLQISGSGWGAATIDDGNEMILLFSNDSTVTVTSTGLQSFETGLRQSAYKHQYVISPAGLQALSNYELIGIRKYSFRDFVDLTVPVESRARAQKLSAVFLSELKRANVMKTLKQITPRDIANYIGDSVSFCSKIFNTRFYESSENRPTVLDVQSDFADPLVNVVILEADRKNFGGPPEKLYLNKEACISGVVMLKNNVPYVQVRSRKQIRVRSQPTLADIALFVGDTVTVTGRIFSTKFFPESVNTPTLLNMGAPYPDQPLTVVIEKDERELFGGNPEALYLDKEVKVSGEVVMFKDRPQIVVRNRSQLLLLNNDAFVTASNTTPSAVFESAARDVTPVADIEIPAQFPGGPDSLVAYFNRSLQTPDALQVGERKTVLASYYVGSDGFVSNVQILQSAGKVYDEEVVRVVQQMPRWKPKTKGLKATGETLKQPFTFSKVFAD